MTTGRGASIACLAVGLAVSALSATAQQLGQSRTILVTVADEHDRPVIDLLPDDFIVQEAGETREVLDARLADYPVVLMVDNGNSTPGDFEPLRQAAEHLVQRLGPRPIALGRISNPPVVLTTLDQPPGAVTEALEGLDMRPSQSSPAQGIIEAGGLLSQTPFPFSTIVVLSSQSTETAQTSMMELARVLAETRARVYVVVHLRGMRDRTNLDYLANLSEQTGGQYIPVYSAASFQPAVDRVADRLLGEMLVEFLEPPGATPDPDVRVGVRRPGARVRGLGITPP